MAVESAADRASFFADFGEVDGGGVAALKWTAGATTIAVPGHLHRGAVTIGVEDGPMVLGRRASFHCAAEALPAAAAEGDTARFDSADHTADYVVKSIEPDGTGLVVVLLEEYVAPVEVPEPDEHPVEDDD